MVALHSDVYEPAYFEVGMMVDTTESLHFDTSACDLDFDSRVQGRKKAQRSVQMNSHSLEWVLIECGVWLRMVDPMKVILD